jgi:hypothetical protein
MEAEVPHKEKLLVCGQGWPEHLQPLLFLLRLLTGPSIISHWGGMPGLQSP